MRDVLTFRYGRLLSDFRVGETYLHPWEVTLDDGMVAMTAASFQDATPLYASAAYARELGFAGRPVPPLLCLNLALSFSVHDVSEQAIAHLAYLDVRFPHAAYVGDTVRARSTVLDVKPSSGGDKGVVHVRTVLVRDGGAIVCAFERKALIRAGRLASRPTLPSTPGPEPAPEAEPLDELARRPPELRAEFEPPRRGETLWGAFEDFRPGQVFAHAVGRTVGESEHMQLTTLFRNSHPLHFDELYCAHSSFTNTRVVYGGLVFGWTAALASRDLAGHALWDLGYAAGAHPTSVAAGDTLYAVSKVLSVEKTAPDAPAGEVRFALVGLKNITALAAVERYGEALFAPELPKKNDKILEKVLEVERALLVARRERARRA